MLVAMTGETARQLIKCHTIKNNKVEYEVVVEGFELVQGLGA